MLVIYWSGTGNTESMAKAISEGGEAKLLHVSEASAQDIEKADKIALGCPAMGAEVLEESEFEPFICEIEHMLNGKKVALFGSYGWGNGEWMEEFETRIKNSGAELIDKGLIINETPDDDGIKKCIELGKKLKEI
ncbi:flavodoxin [Hathewaya histolytica]|uniref:Flavodoxin n=1 Tax=Hathewaya histolytica TaxID=1498 RepID=A0A4U9R6Q1_HATHI|nr:flavodoxin [Hathewaya histolytica]VTQ86418.1 flavodoxin, short chain [Hathewaya histolytica]